MQSRIVSGLV
jgi:hypothetical protein